MCSGFGLANDSLVLELVDTTYREEHPDLKIHTQGEETLFCTFSVPSTVDMEPNVYAGVKMQQITRALAGVRIGVTTKAYYKSF